MHVVDWIIVKIVAKLQLMEIPDHGSMMFETLHNDRMARTCSSLDQMCGDPVSFSSANHIKYMTDWT